MRAAIYCLVKPEGTFPYLSDFVICDNNGVQVGMGIAARKIRGTAEEGAVAEKDAISAWYNPIAYPNGMRSA